MAVDTDEPQTTLVAEVLVPVLDPQTTLKALVVLSLQGIELPQTTDEPQTTEPGRIVVFPFTKETVRVDGL